MTNDNFKTWYVDGLQALVSASEISEKAASANGGMGASPKLKAMLESGAKIATQHTDAIKEMLRKAGGQPHGEPDKVMQGIADAGQDMVGAAKDAEVKDAAVIATTQIGLHYYMAAYATLGATAKRLGMDDDAQTFERLNDHIKDKNDEYSKLVQEMVGA